VINQVAKGVEKGGKIIVKGVEEGGKLLNKGVELGGSYIKSKTTPNETPTPVNPILKGTVKVASSVSPYAVKITKGLATGLAIVAKEIGSVVAHKIIENTSTGQKMSNTFNGPKTEAATNVGKNALIGFVNIWESLEDAAKNLLVQTQKSTVDVVDYKYGKDMGETTGHAISVGIDVVDSVHTAKKVGVKKLAKAIVKETVIETATKLSEDKFL